MVRLLNMYVIEFLPKCNDSLLKQLAIGLWLETLDTT